MSIPDEAKEAVALLIGPLPGRLHHAGSWGNGRRWDAVDAERKLRECGCMNGATHDHCPDLFRCKRYSEAWRDEAWAYLRGERKQYPGL